MAAGEGLALVELDDDGVATAFRADVLAGLGQPQKAVPARWLYDDAGSELFEKITALPEYYPTRAETEILSERCAEFRELIGPGRAVVEFGSGSSVKTPLLLACIAPPPTFRSTSRAIFCAPRRKTSRPSSPACPSTRSRPTSCAR
jgi:uncharacterized SAM-dependent methyltransferase